MNTTTNHRPATDDPFARVTFDPMRHGDSAQPIGWKATCQAITHRGDICGRTATTVAWASGPRAAGHVALCRQHAATRYAISVDPS